jgi:hypothetical protein
MKKITNQLNVGTGVATVDDWYQSIPGSAAYNPHCNIEIGETRLSKATIEANACAGYTYNLETMKWEKVK